MFGLSQGRKKYVRVAIVDIGSASAAVGFLDIAPEGKSTIVAAHRSFIPYEKRSAEQFAARMGGAIEEASTRAMKELASRKDDAAVKLSGIYVFFRAPWIDAKVVRLTKDFGKETRITNEHIDSLSKQALNSKQKLLEAIVLRIELNGYATPDVVGKTAHLLSLYSLVSSVDEKLQGDVAQYIERTFRHLKPTWRSHARALLFWVREHPKHSRDCVAIDISSEGCTILSIRNGILETQSTCDFGLHAILEKLSPHALPEETLGLLRMLEREQCSGTVCDALRASMEKIEQEMLRTFGEQLAQLAGKTRLPHNLTLFVHPDVAPWLTRFFSRLDFAQFTVPLQPFVVTELTRTDVEDWIQIDSAAPDISLLLASTLVHIEAHHKN